MEILILIVIMGLLVALFAGSLAVMAFIHFQIMDDSEPEELNDQTK